MSTRRSGIFSVVLVLILAFGSARAGESIVSVDAEGVGDTRDTAIRLALAEAVAMVNGAEIHSNSKTRISSLTASRTHRDGTRDSVQLDAATKANDSLTTSGAIASYTVRSVKTASDGLVHVSLRVQVRRYERPESTKRKRIALFPVRSVHKSYQIFSKYPASTVVAVMDKALEVALVGTRKFAVLSRRDFAALGTEIGLMESEYSSRDDKVKVGQLLGGDYILLAQIDRASGRNAVEVNPATGQRTDTSGASLRLSVKVLDAPTGEIRFSDSYDVTTPARGLEELAEQAAAVAVADLTERIYPVRIIQIRGDEVTLNSGSGGLNVGDVFRVFAEGERLVDPYTRESLGRSETHVGWVTVERVENKVSFASSDHTDRFRVGNVLRRRRPEEAQAAAVIATEPPSPRDSGIRLPFD